MEEKKLYSVTLCFTKQLKNGELNIGLLCRTLYAMNEHEAFGMAFDSKDKMFSEHQLHIKTIYEIKL